MSLDAQFYVVPRDPNRLHATAQLAALALVGFSDVDVETRDGVERALAGGLRGRPYVEISTMHRYFGPWYATGHWPTIRDMIERLRAAFPLDEIRYGGDTHNCSQFVDDELLAAQDELWSLIKERS